MPNPLPKTLDRPVLGPVRPLRRPLRAPSDRRIDDAPTLLFTKGVSPDVSTSAQEPGAEGGAIEHTRKWPCLVVDFPWPNIGGEKYYNTEKLARLREFPLSDLAAEAAHIWFWTPNRYLYESYQILEAAGFTVHTPSPLTWVKFRLGLGGPYQLRNATEHCLFAVRGNLPVANRSIPTWISAPVTRHSEKPAAIYSIIDAVSPHQRLEVFARDHNAVIDDVFGDEVESTISIPGWPVPSDFTREPER
jgi:N6-adenosine-specific RNA methylase IME4